MPNSLKCKIKHLCHNGTITEHERDRILQALEQEPKTGHWVYRWDKTFLHEYNDCSFCGYMARIRYNFCPNCGAKMAESEVKE